MTPQELKTSILQLAIQGKLVPQLPEEGTGEELYQQIQAEKQSLIKAGKIKKEKPLSEITEDEIPFDIPETWQWVRIRDYCADVFSGKSPVYVKHETKYRIVGQASNQQNGLDFSQVKYTNEEFWYAMDERYFLKTNDILLNTLGNGTLGRSGIVTNLPYPLLTDGHLFVFRFNNEVQAKYFYYYLQLRRAEIEKNANGSTNQTFLSLGKTVSWIVPIPSLAEQKRIVAKIEELLPLIDRYEQAWSRLENFNKRFPVDMQKSILQMAIQGKLVPQLPEEGTGEELFRQIQAEKQRLIKAGTIKKEKPLPEITDDEIPFDIPDSWKWVHLQSLCSLIGDIDHNMPKSVDPKEGVLFLSAKDLLDDGTINYTDNVKYISQNDFERLSRKALPRRNDIIYSRIGAALGKARVVKSDVTFLVSYSCCVIRPLFVDVKFLRYYLESPLILAHSVKARQSIGVPDLGMGEIKKYLVALPSLAEQKRIVAKLEEILPLCERLK